jgi:hypothetical protein
MTSADRQIEQWRQQQRRSQRALPVEVGILLLVAVPFLTFMWAVEALPPWPFFIVVGCAAFAVLGDAINILYLRGKLRRAERRAN